MNESARTCTAGICRPLGNIAQQTHKVNNVPLLALPDGLCRIPLYRLERERQGQGPDSGIISRDFGSLVGHFSTKFLRKALIVGHTHGLGRALLVGLSPALGDN